jgi:hypothetical protein
MITRKQYLADSKTLHARFFEQFISEETLQFIEDKIGIEKLKASECPHLNDVVEWEQGGRTWLWDRTPIATSRLKAHGECDSRSVRTCVGKVAARQLLAAHLLVEKTFNQ